MEESGNIGFEVYPEAAATAPWEQRQQSSWQQEGGDSDGESDGVDDLLTALRSRIDEHITARVAALEQELADALRRVAELEEQRAREREQLETVKQTVAGLLVQLGQQ